MSTKMCRKVVASPQNTNKHVSKMLLIPPLDASMKPNDGYILSASGSYLSLQKIPLSGSQR